MISALLYNIEVFILNLHILLEIWIGQSRLMELKFSITIAELHGQRRIPDVRTP